MVDRVRFLRFGVVGVANTLITIAVFNVAALMLHVPALGANALGWAAGFANSYFWNRRWTFADRPGVAGGRSLRRFAIASLAALAASSAVIAALQALAQTADVHTRFSAPIVLNAIEAVAIMASLTINYALATAWAFKEDPA